MTALPMGVHVSVHVNELTMVKTKVNPEHSGYAVVDLRNGPDVALFFRTVADMDRVLEAMKTARHKLAALTEHNEPVGDTANTPMVATHADAA